mmetsp:Transcript_48003/g.153471  ORF Transcript_48003/g.153471 Transcript_48003/m.153471 type:complete len:210 (+) Transcript_48003:103-732(+)
MCTPRAAWRCVATLPTDQPCSQQLDAQAADPRRSCRGRVELSATSLPASLQAADLREPRRQPRGQRQEHPRVSRGVAEHVPGQRPQAPIRALVRLVHLHAQVLPAERLQGRLVGLSPVQLPGSRGGVEQADDEEPEVRPQPAQVAPRRVEDLEHPGVREQRPKRPSEHIVKAQSIQHDVATVTRQLHRADCFVEALEVDAQQGHTLAIG